MLSKAEIKELIETGKMIDWYLDLDTQLQANGFDLTVEKVGVIGKWGLVDFDNSRRDIPRVDWELTRHIGSGHGEVEGWYLYPGYSYAARIAEMVNLPENVSALTFARSSLMRCGVYVSNAVWDKGYHGCGMVSLHTMNPVILTYRARIIQMVFFPVAADGSRYEGQYQGENV